MTPITPEKAKTQTPQDAEAKALILELIAVDEKLVTLAQRHAGLHFTYHGSLKHLLEEKSEQIKKEHAETLTYQKELLEKLNGLYAKTPVTPTPDAPKDQ